MKLKELKAGDEIVVESVKLVFLSAEGEKVVSQKPAVVTRVSEASIWARVINPKYEAEYGPTPERRYTRSTGDEHKDKSPLAPGGLVRWLRIVQIEGQCATVAELAPVWEAQRIQKEAAVSADAALWRMRRWLDANPATPGQAAKLLALSNEICGAGEQGV